MTARAVHGGPAARFSRIAQSITVYLGFVAVALMLLVHNPIRLIDYEELDYGELPIALVDGLVTLDNLGSFQTYAREGSLLLWAPFVAAVFAALGPSLFSLKLSGILIGGLWAVAWYRVARLAIPRVPPILIGLAFVFPVPLIQISSISTTSVMAHFGSSLWHGASLLALCVAVTSPNRRAGRAAILAGLACGFGIYCGYSLLPLVPGLVWVVLRTGRVALLRQWLLGTLPGLALAAAFLASTALEGVDRAEPIGIYAIVLLRRLLLYGAGVYVGAERILPESLVFSSIALVYPLLLATVVGWVLGRPSRSPASNEDAALGRAVNEGLFISCLGMLGALWITRYSIDLWAFDGLRYFLPMAAPLTVIFLSFASRLPRPGPQVAMGAFITLNVGIYSSLILPLERAEYLDSTRGYHGSFFLHSSYAGPRLDQGIPAARAAHYALWIGAAEALDGTLDTSAAGRGAAFPSSDARAEFFRGVGLGRAVRSPCIEQDSCVPAGTPAPLARNVWQGVGLSSHCGTWRSTLAMLPASARDSFLWGLGRGSYHDCEDWPRDPAFSDGARTSIVERFALDGEEESLRHSIDERPLPLFAAPELRRTVERLSKRSELTAWWLR